MSSTAVLNALATLMPAGTTVGASSVVVQKGLALEGLTWPGLILNAPRRRRVREANHAKSWLYEVHALYLDRFDAGTRTQEQALVDAETALLLMVANVEATTELVVGGVQNAFDASEEFDVTLDGPLDDPGLGFPVIQGEIVFEVKDFWETAT